MLVRALSLVLVCIADSTACQWGERWQARHAGGLARHLFMAMPLQCEVGDGICVYMDDCTKS